MIMNYAIVDSSNLVISVVVWDGASPWQPLDDCTAVLIPDGSEAWTGWSYADGQFVQPAES